MQKEGILYFARWCRGQRRQGPNWCATISGQGLKPMMQPAMRWLISKNRRELTNHCPIAETAPAAKESQGDDGSCQARQSVPSSLRQPITCRMRRGATALWADHLPVF